MSPANNASFGSSRRSVALICLAVVMFIAAACTYEAKVVVPVLPIDAQASTVYAADGTLLTTLVPSDLRRSIPYEDLPPQLIAAVLSIEDSRFFLHAGVDLRAIVRAARSNARVGSVQQGGSTITQQYVKIALLDPDQTLERKIREAAVAYRLEQTHSKEHILEIYLNTIYFGQGAYGIEAAANRYFDLSTNELSLSQAALLAGLIRAPGIADPYTDLDAASDRRDIVLARMRVDGAITVDDFSRAVREPVNLTPRFEPTEQYPAGHFIEEVKQFVMNDPRFGATVDERRRLLFTGGLRIETTLDLDLQSIAEQAIDSVLQDPESDPDAALVAIEPNTGEVKAMVGGRDYFGDSGFAQYNLAVGTGRQAGSAFKPIVLAAALQQGIASDTVYPAPGRISLEIPDVGGTWRVSNYGGGGPGEANLIDATIHSYNTVYAQLMADVGPEQAVQMAARLGVRSPLKPVMAAVLGTENVSALDMVTVYATFANRGIYLEPALVSRVVRSDGSVIYEHTIDGSKAIDADVADEVTGILERVIEEGTGKKAQLGRPAAGKTGTAQDWKDAWFVGYTPQLATSVWVGFAEKPVSMRPPITDERVTGGSWPAQIWRRFETDALASEPIIPFRRPPSSTTILQPSLTRHALPRDTFGEVPNLEGDPLAKARQRLAALGYVIEIITSQSDTFRPGTIIRSSPAPGERLDRASIVEVWVADEESHKPVPAPEERRAAETGSTPTSSLRPPDSIVPPTDRHNTATDQTERGAAASLDEPPRLATVPSVVSDDVADAMFELNNKRFDVIDRVTSGPPDTESGIVWKQQPSGGTPMIEGSTVVIWVQP